MPNLTFPLRDLKRVQSGEKRETRRVSAVLHRTKPGDPLSLQFGARNNPTTLHGTVTAVEVLDYLAYRDRLVSGKDPRGELDGAAFDAEIEHSGSPEERRMLEVARQYGETMTAMVEQLDDATLRGVERMCERRSLTPRTLSAEQMADLERRNHARVVILTFAVAPV